jgi:hypothetical protein
MSAPLVLEKITHYREGEVIVLTPQGGAPVPLKDPEIVKQFTALLKKLKTSEEIAEPLQIGDASYTLAPSLTVDSIGGPVFWEEIVELVKAGRG